ncbi:GNAT family N-acetyltransferase [Psychromonas marina]|uniref:GNAT family N-acetyltransferase n=1 Tax=Psychromonas marina TaxID=88364 RepID=UPI0024E127E9|nr:GNAT family N-acetyltransferase [Psychromonas marina]
MNIKHLNAFERYFNECVTSGLDLYHGDYESYLIKRIRYSQGKGLPEGWPPMSMYLCFESDIIVGSIRVRHGTNDYIRGEIGHIGYETSPKARGQGVATTMLQWVIDNVIEDKVIVTCAEDNIGSRKVIEKCGGDYLDRLYSEEKVGYLLRYQLTPK